MVSFGALSILLTFRRALKSPAERRANHNATERIRREALNEQFMELAAELPPNMIQQCTVPTANGQKKPSKTHIITQTWRFLRGLKMKILLRENLVAQLITQNCERSRALNEMKSVSSGGDSLMNDLAVDANQIVALLNQQDQLIDYQISKMQFSFELDGEVCPSPAPSVLSHADSVATADDQIGDSVLSDPMPHHQPVAVRPATLSILYNNNNNHHHHHHHHHQAFGNTHNVNEHDRQRSKSAQHLPSLMHDLDRSSHTPQSDPFLSTPETPSFTVTSMATTNDEMLQFDDIDPSQFIANETMMNDDLNTSPHNDAVNLSKGTLDATEMMKQYQMLFELQNKQF